MSLKNKQPSLNGERALHRESERADLFPLDVCSNNKYILGLDLLTENRNTMYDGAGQGVLRGSANEKLILNFQKRSSRPESLVYE